MIVRQSETVHMQVTKQGEATSTMAAKYQVLGVWKENPKWRPVIKKLHKITITNMVDFISCFLVHFGNCPVYFKCSDMGQLLNFVSSHPT